MDFPLFYPLFISFSFPLPFPLSSRTCRLFFIFSSKTQLFPPFETPPFFFSPSSPSHVLLPWKAPVTLVVSSPFDFPFLSPSPPHPFPPPFSDTFYCPAILALLSNRLFILPHTKMPTGLTRSFLLVLFLFMQNDQGGWCPPFPFSLPPCSPMRKRPSIQPPYPVNLSERKISFPTQLSPERSPPSEVVQNVLCGHFVTQSS